MSWTVPATQTTGTLVTAALFNQQIVDNMAALAVHGHTGAVGDGATLNPIPTGIILVFDAACPTGWTRVSAFDSKFIRGATAYGATGGAATHKHTYIAHTHTHTHAGYGFPAAAEVEAIDASGGASSAYAATNHTHTLIRTGAESAFDTAAAGDTSTNDSLPAYQNVIFCKKDA